MHYKLTILGACAPYSRLIYIEFHSLSRKERKMTCHQNPGPAYHICDHHLVIGRLPVLTRD